MKLPWVAQKPNAEASPKELVDSISEQLKSSISWKRSQGYYERWPEYENFRQGKQWPDPTTATETFPRPVINVFQTIVDQKVSAILAEEPEVTFLPREGQPEEEVMAAQMPGMPMEQPDQQLLPPQEAYAESADNEASILFTKVAKYTSEEVDMEELNEAVIDTACVIGTGASYWYWDPSKRGGNPDKMTAYEGDIAGEEIDPADLHLGNPKEKDIQKQPWIIITARTPVEAFREFYREHAAKLGVDIMSIQPDKKQNRDEMYDSEQQEMDATEYIDEVRRFRKVYNPETRQVEIWYEVSAADQIIRIERPLFKYSNRYPISLFVWKRVRKCAFGEGEGPNIIEAQKAVNRLLAMSIWNGYLTAWTKIRFKKGAVDKNKITNQPGEMIEDQIPGQWNIDYMQPPTVPGYVRELFESIPDMLKNEAGVHEAMVGQAPSAELNAQAILMLQKAAGVRISRISRNFRRYLRDVAKIWEAFYKEFYTERRLIRITEENNARGFFWFRGTDHSNIDFDVKISVSPNSTMTESMVVSELKEHLDKQRITFEQYLENVPQSVLPMKEKLLQEYRAAKLAAEQQAMQALQNGQLPPGMPPEAFPELMAPGPENQLPPQGGGI